MKWIHKLKKKEMKVLKWSLESNFGIKILAILMAVFMFLTINEVGDPIWNDWFFTTETITNVPLNVEYDTDEYVVYGIPSSINLTVKGTKNEVQTIMNSKNNLSATLDLTNYEAGKYEINSNRISYNTNGNVNFNPEINEINANIQNKIIADKQVDLSYINGEKSTNSIILDTPEKQQDTIQVEGGEDDVSSVVSVRGLIDLETLKTNEESGTVTQNVKLVPYDAKGNVVSNVSVVPKTIDVTQKYHVESVTLPVYYEFENVPDNVAIKSVCDTAIECDDNGVETVKVYGDDSKIKKMDNVTYEIDYNDIVSESTINVTPELDSGVYIEGGATKELAVETEEKITTKFEDVPIQVIGLKSEYKVKNMNELKTDVEVTGAQSNVEELEKETLGLTVDLSDVDEAGSYTEEISTPNQNKILYNLSEKEIKLTVEKE